MLRIFLMFYSLTRCRRFTYMRFPSLSLSLVFGLCIEKNKIFSGETGRNLKPNRLYVALNHHTSGGVTGDWLSERHG